MKRIFWKIFFEVFLFCFFSINFSFGQTTTISFKNPVSATSFDVILGKTIDLLFWIAVGLLPLFGLFSAFQILTSGGNPEKIDLAKRIIIYALLGFFIITFAKAVKYIIFSLLGI
jgi:hypothetical protein